MAHTAGMHVCLALLLSTGLTIAFVVPFVIFINLFWSAAIIGGIAGAELFIVLTRTLDRHSEGGSIGMVVLAGIAIVGLIAGVAFAFATHYGRGFFS